MPRLAALLVVSFVALSGCRDDGADVVADAPDDVSLVSCGVSGPTFPRTALEAASAAPPPDASMEAATESFLGSAEGDFWPQDRWRVLWAGEERAVLVADDGSQLWFQTLERQEDSWTWSGSGAVEDCPLRIATPEGFNAVEWRLDPAATPSERSTEIQVLVMEVACASGEPVGDRLVVRDVERTEHEVRIGFVAKTQPGAHECPSNPEMRVTVDLGEPLGDRDLVDAYDLDTTLRDHL